MIPCKDCLLIPICRHLDYRVMLHKCMPLTKTLYHQTPSGEWKVDSHLRTHGFSKLVKEVELAINPSIWRTEQLTEHFVSIKDKNDGT